eukprot:CAMPEP_0182893764 /NCGR_PEP_ID=MMETSP0034_2-20130328/24670_1 /TAXON_ID=156128 /ORGANISM="Nephroselmis pyriformis, Strain CCMP717" /LENGTH=356 /DNA_ID=CAMNT_0025027527 /DNA_START=10 /DNA_END=1077 /DNA_ORIENTATION=-
MARKPRGKGQPAPKPPPKKPAAKPKKEEVKAEAPEDIDPETGKVWPGIAQGLSFDRNKPVRVYADGIFDLFHFGHAKCLEQAKKLFPNTTLVVGCCSDALTVKYKGLPVLKDTERYESLRHCRWVDEVIEDAPWVLDEAFLTANNIDFVAHDDLPYADASGAADDVYAWVKSLGKFAATQRTEGISTSDIILRVLKDYNDYVLRNLGRGYSRKDLNINAWKETTIRTRGHIKNLKRKVVESQSMLSEKVREQQKRVAGNIARTSVGMASMKIASRVAENNRIISGKAKAATSRVEELVNKRVVEPVTKVQKDVEHLADAWVKNAETLVQGFAVRFYHHAVNNLAKTEQRLEAAFGG